MTNHVYTTLREANRVRQAEWDKDGQISLSYRGNELAGETGEACNIIKKIERERLGIRGSRASVQDLAAELADVVICSDLIAMAEDIDLDAAVAEKFNATSEKVGLATRLSLDSQVEQAERMRMVVAALKVALATTNAGHVKACIQAALDYATNDREALAEGAALRPVQDDDVQPCEACGQAMKEGDAYYPDHNNGGVLHAECVGPEREGFTDGEGNPLAADAPIPTPLTWSEAV